MYLLPILYRRLHNIGVGLDGLWPGAIHIILVLERITVSFILYSYTYTGLLLMRIRAPITMGGGRLLLHKSDD